MPAERTRSLYRRTLTEPVFVRRYTGTGPNRPFFDYEAHAQVIAYQPHELTGLIQQGDRKVILFAQDLIDGQFPFPMKANSDQIVVRGTPLMAIVVDDSTRRDDNELMALEITARG